MLRVLLALAWLACAVGRVVGKDPASIGAGAADDKVELVFLSVGSKANLPGLHALVKHIEASSSLPLRTHVVTDDKDGGAAVRASMPWLSVHLLSDMPDDAKAMHVNFTNLTHGPYGAMYMWKPLLHKLLPMRRALVLDADLLVLDDIAKLWRAFDAFDEGTVLGLAQEQAPSYSELKHGGVNGGVQLLNLEGMRRSGGPYAIELQRASNGEYGHIGYLGDQTFYSWMRDKHPHIFFPVGCGWNRQLSYHYYSAEPEREKVFVGKHACADTCSLIHGNENKFKHMIFKLQETKGKVTCEQCKEVFAAENYTETYDNARKLGLKYMSKVFHDCCCGSSA